MQRTWAASYGLLSARARRAPCLLADIFFVSCEKPARGRWLKVRGPPLKPGGPVRNSSGSPFDSVQLRRSTSAVTGGQTVYICIHISLYTHRFVPFGHTYTHTYTHVCGHLSIYLSTFLFIYLPMHLLIYLSIYPSIFLPMYLPMSSISL